MNADATTAREKGEKKARRRLRHLMKKGMPYGDGMPLKMGAGNGGYATSDRRAALCWRSRAVKRQRLACVGCSVTCV